MKSENSALRVTVQNLQRKIRVNAPRLQRFAQKAAELCLRLQLKRSSDLEKLHDVSVLIVSDRRMAALHRRFMNQAGPTDVLTFEHGEIFVSADTATRNAVQFGNQLSAELRLYIVHGLLHLHGFDDRDPANARKMRTAERTFLRKLR